MALAYHAREHGAVDAPEYVLVQGRAEPVDGADARGPGAGAPPGRAVPRRRPQRAVLGPLAARVLHGAHPGLGARRSGSPSGPTWTAPGEPERYGLPEPATAPDPQRAPANGTGTAREHGARGQAARKTPHLLLGHLAADGYPTLGPVELGASDATGLELAAAPGVIPAGARRAGLLGHDYRPKLIGLTARQHTGWLEAGDDRALYAPPLGRPASWRRPTRRCCCSATGCRRSWGCAARRAGKLPA